MEEGERTFKVVFNNPSSLITYIKYMDENLAIFKPFASSDEVQFHYPQFIIKIMKKQKNIAQLGP